MIAMLQLTRVLLTGAILLTGSLAGLDVDRALVANQAWRQVGAIGWATFSRHADLANGLLVYPFQAIGGALLTFAVLVCSRRANTVAAWVLCFVYLAFGLSVGGLLLTMKAAPIMLAVRGVNDPAALQRMFEAFGFWGNLRSVCQIGAFVSLVCARLQRWVRRYARRRATTPKFESFGFASARQRIALTRSSSQLHRQASARSNRFAAKCDRARATQRIGCRCSTRPSYSSHAKTITGAANHSGSRSARECQMLPQRVEKSQLLG